ncbi:methylthioribose kinase [Anaerobacillus sp. MEB173]|uniref:DUF7147 family protein n=1 Tax=Anaerobacillus sp. MEB173 TaxID=3383345 RepID=UPI003F8FC168
MIQRFIELGEGFSDIYELVELARANQHRVQHLLTFHTTINNRKVTSPVVILKPTNPGNFLPLYICREGIPQQEELPNKRYELFQQVSNELGKEIIKIDVKPSTDYEEVDLYYQYLIAILRLNYLLPPLQ